MGAFGFFSVIARSGLSARLRGGGCPSSCPCGCHRKKWYDSECFVLPAMLVAMWLFVTVIIWAAGVGIGGNTDTLHGFIAWQLRQFWKLCHQV
jgi:hypothetical protein